MNQNVNYFVMQTLQFTLLVHIIFLGISNLHYLLSLHFWHTHKLFHDFEPALFSAKNDQM